MSTGSKVPPGRQPATSGRSEVVATPLGSGSSKSARVGPPTIGLLSLVLLAVVLWLISGVKPSEVARYLPYELCFVVAPGVLVASLVLGRTWRLRTIVLGWGIGYLLEILAYMLSAAAGIRSWFPLYPVVVGLPALLLHLRRHNRAPRAWDRRPAPALREIALIGAPCAGVLLSTAGSYFSQFPLPRSVAAATYQEDTPFTISLAGEVLHHWPATLPQVGGQPLHYHLGVYLHLAAIADITGIDLSVIVMRLYVLPLLTLLVLMIVVLGRDMRGRSAVGVLAALLTVLVRSTPAHGSFSFNDLSYSWLTDSHTQLLGLVFFVGALLLSLELLAAESPSTGALARTGCVLAAYLVGCALAKEYVTLPPLALGSFVFALGVYVRRREVSWRALSVSAGAAICFVVAVKVQLHAGSGGFGLRPLGFIRSTPVAHALTRALGAPAGLAVAAIVVPLGLLGPAMVAGLALLAALRRHQLTDRHYWLLAVFVSGSVPLFLLNQPGLGQLQMFMLTCIAGSVLAAEGLDAGAGVLRRSLGRRACVGVALTAIGAALFLFGSVSLSGSPLPDSVGRTRIFLGLATVALALIALSRRRSPVWRAGFVGVAAVGGLVASDYLWIVRLVARKLRGDVVLGRSFPRVPIAAGMAFEAIGLIGLCLAVAGLWQAFGGDGRRFALRSMAVVTPAVAALASGMVAVPLAWAPVPILRIASGQPPYNQQNKGVTRGLYDALRWVRRNTPANTVLAVNNFSLDPTRGAKDFMYSALSERRIVLEGWDYTPQAAKTDKFSLPLSETPFPGRVVAECAAIDFADRGAIAFLRDRYGASYLFADLVHGRASPDLGRHATLVFHDHDAAVYRIPTGLQRSVTGSQRFVATPAETVGCLTLRERGSAGSTRPDRPPERGPPAS